MNFDITQLAKSFGIKHDEWDESCAPTASAATNLPTLPQHLQ